MREKLVYMTFGGLLTLIGISFTLILTPVTAQRDRFGEIECTKLKIIGNNNQEPLVIIGKNSQGGIITVENKTASSSIQLTTTRNGGQLAVYGSGHYEKALAIIKVNEHGNGTISTWKHDGQRLHTLGLTNTSAPPPATNTVFVPANRERNRRLY